MHEMGGRCNMHRRNEYKILVGKSEGKGARYKRWKNMRMDLREGIDLIHLAQNTDQW
jgi:hypothetical protein